MKLKLAILAVAVTATTGLAAFAAVRGLGVPSPIKEPVSLREGSARDTPLATGRGRTRYLIGGGFRGGK